MIEMVKYIKVCPKCGSENIGQEMDRISRGIDSDKPSKWEYCKDCGHGLRGYPARQSDFSRESSFSFSKSFPEVREDKLEEFRKELKEGDDDEVLLAKRESPFIEGEFKRKKKLI